MQSAAKAPQNFIDSLPADHKTAMHKLRESILKNLPAGYTETVSYGMLVYAVPHSMYPKGYHVDPKLPLGLMWITSQKNCVSLHHMGLYADKKLLNWFVKEYPKHCKTKLDMGKSCIRFKKMDDIPFDLIGDLAKKLTPQQWIDVYEEQLNLALKAKESRKKVK